MLFALSVSPSKKSTAAAAAEHLFPTAHEDESFYFAKNYEVVVSTASCRCGCHHTTACELYYSLRLGLYMIIIIVGGKRMVGVPPVNEVE